MRRHPIALACLLFVGGIFAAAASPASLPLPAPGTYALNHIQRVPFAIVLEGNHVPHFLSSYTRKSITLLSFFYTSCTDPQGCPLAWEAFESLRETIKQRSDLQGKIRLVFISLDPPRDTPEMLRVFARGYADDAAIVPWHFLTTYSSYFLDPLLREMGAEVAIDRAASSTEASVLNHLLKVFLIDKEGWVREIYSTATLDRAAILGDIETLLIEARKKPN